MANEHLKIALARAGLTVEQFAEIISVDPKTVQRWAAGRTPYPRHRATIARALDIPEHELWPDDVPPPPVRAGGHEQPAAGDVTGSWGRTDDPSAPHPVDLLAPPVQRIDVLAAGAVLHEAGLIGALRDRAREGCEVRIITRAPTEELAVLLGDERIKVRVIDSDFTGVQLCVDDAMLLVVPVASPGPPPLLRLHRNGDHGWFDRLTEHFQAFWENAEVLADGPPLSATPPNDQSADPRHEPQPSGSAASEERPTPAPPPADPTSRRWPRRPS